MKVYQKNKMKIYPIDPNEVEKFSPKRPMWQIMIVGIILVTLLVIAIII